MVLLFYCRKLNVQISGDIKIVLPFKILYNQLILKKYPHEIILITTNKGHNLKVIMIIEQVIIRLIKLYDKIS